MNHQKLAIVGNFVPQNNNYGNMERSQRQHQFESQPWLWQTLEGQSCGNLATLNKKAEIFCVADRK
ncbi:MAG: hypothetical protein KAF91_17775 [Nostoc sp. TH1S01]|nr:hypothetical protein [Nostoc sp. TH1S01]